MINKFYSVFAVVVLTAFFLLPQNSIAAQDDEITPQELIELVNSLRSANGLPPLNVNSLIMGTAQSFADQMAAQELTWHIGGHREAIAAAGYGTGKTVWATENFAMGYGAYTLANVQAVWSDDLHMKPMREAKYCDIGAGVATAASGMTYYIVQVAYTTPGECEISDSSDDFSTKAETSTQTTADKTNDLTETNPIEISDEDLTHTVVLGDSLWGIAQTYQTNIEAIQTINNLESDEIYIGQKLLVPTSIYSVMTKTALVTRMPTSTPQVTATPAASTGTLQPRSSATAARTAANTPTKAITATNTAEAPAQTELSQTPGRQSLFWPITAGVEFLALLVIIGVFWQPWKNKKFF